MSTGKPAVVSKIFIQVQNQQLQPNQMANIQINSSEQEINSRKRYAVLKIVPKTYAINISESKLKMTPIAYDQIYNLSNEFPIIIHMMYFNVLWSFPLP